MDQKYQHTDTFYNFNSNIIEYHYRLWNKSYLHNVWYVCRFCVENEHRVFSRMIFILITPQNAINREWNRNHDGDKTQARIYSPWYNLLHELIMTWLFSVSHDLNICHLNANVFQVRLHKLAQGYHVRYFTALL